MNTKNKVIKTKDPYWQCVRGLCIIAVVLIHCRNGIGYQNNSNISWNFDYWLIMRQFINFPVAVFIFLSGYFTNIESAKKLNIPYLATRGRRLLLPFWLWSTFYTLIKVILAEGEINVFKTVAKLVLGLSSGPLYFILVLLQLTMLSPFLIRKINNNNKRLFVVTPIYLVIMYLYSVIFGKQMPFYHMLFPAWFGFYYLGLWIKINGYKPRVRKNIVKSVLICFTGLIFSILEGYVLLSIGFSVGFASSQIKITSFFYALALINFLESIKPYFDNKGMKLLKQIGDNSYGIYYVHMFWITISSKLLLGSVVLVENLPAFQLVQVVVVVFSSFSIFIVKKIIGKKLANQLLGF